MNLADAGRVLAKCVAFDNRQTTAETIKAWAEALDDMPLADALSFVTRHYATSRDWIMPSDINREWKMLRTARQRAIPEAQRPQPPQDLDGSDYLAFRRAVSRAISHGQSAPQVEAAAWAAIGRTPPPQEISSHHETAGMQIGRTL